MPIPILIAKLILILKPLAPLAPALIRIFRFIPRNQHGQVIRAIQLVYRRFGFETTKNLIINAGEGLALIAALKKLLKDDY